MITIEDFRNLDLRVAKIIKAERIEQSDKLLRLILDLGEESGLGEKQIIAGIGKAYSPEDLIDREIIVVANLEPREIMGLESQGMLLAAKDVNNQHLSLLQPDKEISPGSPIS